MSSIGDGIFHEGEPVWVVEQGGSQRAAEYVGEGETNAWFGGPPMVIIVYTDTRAGGLVETDRVLRRAI
ncbi:MAG: hypothetical protein ABSF58_00720 [Solirubrobacteraceae bacterium]|jgi:hypothetical protein